MSRRVYVHIGAPKTGTTYVQDRLALNREELSRHDVHYPLPGGKTAAHYHAALDLLGQPGGYEDTTGHWDTLVRQATRVSGTAIISHEILASAPKDKIQRVMRDLGDSEVHLVYSARDLSRQIPAAWQEGVKNAKGWSYASFLEKVVGTPRTNSDWFFWKVQSLPDVLSRWSDGLPPDRVHLVTVPGPDAPKDLLWHRFCEVFGIDPFWAPADSERSNPSMGAAETTVIRRLNRRLRKSGLSQAEMQPLVKELLVHQNLAHRPTKRPVSLPPDRYPWANEVAEEWANWVEGSGIHVVGDVDELRPGPAPDAGTWPDPDRPKRREMTEATLDALAAMTVEAARRPDPGTQFSAKIGRAARRLRGQ